jgi:tetratricopeptide (TPR) repeat protein
MLRSSRRLNVAVYMQIAAGAMVGWTAGCAPSKGPVAPGGPSDVALAPGLRPEPKAAVTSESSAPFLPSVSAALPPPKPTTIALDRTGALELDPLLRSADRAFEDGDYDRALAGYESAKKQAPKRAAPLVGIARVRVVRACPTLGYALGEKNADVQAAARALERAVELEPAFGPAHVELGRARLLLGDASRAERALVRGVELLPDEPEAHSALGIALLASGKTERALASLRKATDLDPGSAARRGNYGTVLFLSGRVEQARAEYEVQITLTPDDPRARSDFGTALIAAGDVDRGTAELRRAIELDPKRAAFHSNLGYALQLQGKLSEAISYYREALALDPKLASAWINLATALSRNPKTRGEARRALQTAGGLDPTDPRVKANLEELDALERQAGAPVRQDRR